MLKQRIFTALALAAVLFPALFARAAWPFALALGALTTAAMWEWARLSGFAGRSALIWAAAAALACVAASFVDVAWLWQLAAMHALLLLACVLWVAGGAWLLAQGVGVWQRIPRGLRAAGGWLALACAWLSAVYLRGHWGREFLFSVLALVWVADIGAYFVGRALGRRKLAPSISPGKSWAGVWGGLGSVCALALIWALALQRENNLYAFLLQHGGWPLLLAAGTALVAASVVGDLIESLMKRSMGLKDSSRLLPGHGGVLDRIDAILPTLPLTLGLLMLLERLWH